MAQLLLGRPVWTFVAGLLIAVEGLNVVQSRVALLDIHLAFWVTLGFLLLLLDRRWIGRRTDARAAQPTPTSRRRADDAEPDVDGRRARAEAAPLRVPSPFLRPWRLAAGAAFGAAMAVKWSGAMAIPAAVLLTYIWETTRRRQEGRTRGSAFVRALGLETLGVVVAFAIVPVVVYTLTWVPVVRALRCEPGRLPHPAPRHVELPPRPARDGARRRRPTRSRRRTATTRRRGRGSRCCAP